MKADAKAYSKKRLSSVSDLKDAGVISSTQENQLKPVEEAYAIGVTDHLSSIIDGGSQAVRKQYIPSSAELIRAPEELSDPIGDEEHAPTTGLIHRYPDRVLFKLSAACAVYCRYCFRRDMVGQGAAMLSPQDIDNALSYIRAHRDIWEVILSGGDPLSVSARHLAPVFENLNAMDHVKTIRIHSRVPVADPARITPELCTSLQSKKAVYMAVHINHVDEITPDVERALDDLQKAGCILLSQSVLLNGVNDDPLVLETLMRRLVSLSVKPYYIHHPDLAPGTGHFRLPLERGRLIMRQLLGRLSGLCQPTYMLDIPGGFGKVPVTADFIERIDQATYHVTDYQGQTHIYKDSV
jgi:lysine 2,3-aminomutase